MAKKMVKKGRINFSMMLKRRLMIMSKGKKKNKMFISKLPDEILVSIMSLLRTDEAARMSVLSRRWHRIWNTCIRITPRLRFFLNRGWSLSMKTCDLKKKMRKRISEVYKVLKLHKAPTLYEFSITALKLSTSQEDSHHINTWMDFAAKKHVKELSLKLTSLMDYDAIFIADNFHSLRDLYLEGINVTENFIHRLFSNSPFLQRFSLLNSNKSHRLSIVSAPSLNSLFIYRCNRLQHLQISSSAENLNTIEINGGVNFESVNVSTPNLSHIFLGLQRRGFKFDAFLTLLNQIKRLTIDINTNMISAPFPQFPEFSKLEHLELIMDYCSKIIPTHRLVDIVKAAPFLNTFLFQDDKLVGHPAKDNALKWLDMHIPKEMEVNQNHSYHYLKVVKFGNFAGCQYEVEFLLHLLKYAVSVEKIFISLMDSSTWRDRKDWGRNYEDEFDNQYEEFCIECAQLLKTKILQMNPNAEVIIA